MAFNKQICWTCSGKSLTLAATSNELHFVLNIYHSLNLISFEPDLMQHNTHTVKNTFNPLKTNRIYFI
jgi:hypothetical protein